MPKPRPTPRERFDAKVDKNGPLAKNLPDLGPCWLWTAYRDSKGYGSFDNRRAHRWAWEAEHGPVPVGLELDHFACDNRGCVRPTHVRPVTHKQNMERGVRAMKTHCPYGHPYDETNTFVYDGRRNCKVCKAERQRKYRASKRGSRAAAR